MICAINISLSTVYITTIVILVFSFVIGLIITFKGNDKEDKKDVKEVEVVKSTENFGADEKHENNHGFESVPQIDPNYINNAEVKKVDDKEELNKVFDEVSDSSVVGDKDLIEDKIDTPSGFDIPINTVIPTFNDVKKDAELINNDFSISQNIEKDETEVSLSAYLSNVSTGTNNDTENIKVIESEDNDERITTTPTDIPIITKIIDNGSFNGEDVLIKSDGINTFETDETLDLYNAKKDENAEDIEELEEEII